MDYNEVLAQARTCMGPYCKACPVCNGLGCRNTVPGPGAKGLGTGFIRNYQKWQELCLNMDTICENGPRRQHVRLLRHEAGRPRHGRPRRRDEAALRRQVRRPDL